MAWYQKYRPKVFDDLVGQDFIKNILSSEASQNEFSHAYLFFGSRGTGKTSTARILAKSLNCENRQKNGNPCNQCEFCLSADVGNFVDLIEIDGASNRKIEHARNLIQKINFAPVRAKRKIYIIDEVHMLTREAFNALLKTLEEPPEHAFFILATTEPQKIPETVRSRCQIFSFSRFSEKQIYEHLKKISEQEKISIDPEVFSIIAKKANGGLRDAISILEQVASLENISKENIQIELGILENSQIKIFWEKIKNSDTKDAIGLIQKIAEEGIILENFLDQFLAFLREEFLNQINKNEKKEIVAQMINLINIFSKARLDLKNAIIPTLPIEIAIVQSTKLNNFNFEEKKSGGIFGIFSKTEPEKTENEKKKRKLISNEEKTEKSPEISLTPFSEDSAHKNWPYILEKISDPGLKMSLKDAIIEKIDQKNSTITLIFASNFSREKFLEPGRIAVLLKILQETFGKEIEIITKFKPVILDNKIEKAESKNLENSSEIGVSEIEEIFGPAKN